MLKQIDHLYCFIFSLKRLLYLTYVFIKKFWKFSEIKKKDSPTKHVASKPIQNSLMLLNCTNFKILLHIEMTDPCTGNTCVNGNCVVSGTVYTCQCNSGFSGSNCDMCKYLRNPWGKLITRSY